MEERKCGRILIIGSDELELKMLENTLQTEYSLTMVDNNGEALRIVQDLLPDLILLDDRINLTDGNVGFRELYDMATIKGIPIILLTPSEDEEYLDAAMSMGISDYIVKPIHAPIVRRRIQNYIDIKQLRDWMEDNSDSLTHMMSRHRFMGILKQEWERAKRNGTVLSVMIIDIDGFKAYNASYGHEQGDYCLQRTAHAITKLLKRSSDIVSRWGGADFACILPETDFRGTLLIGEIIRKEIGSLKLGHDLAKTDAAVTVSIGTSSIRPAQDGKCEDILILAEQALYTAKQAGGNKVEGLVR